MKTILSVFITALVLVSCSKQTDDLPVKKPVQPTGTFIVINSTDNQYRVELWRYNSGGLPPYFYTVEPHDTLTVKDQVAGEYIMGILQMTGFADQEHRIDYGFNATLLRDCYYETLIKNDIH